MDIGAMFSGRRHMRLRDRMVFGNLLLNQLMQQNDEDDEQFMMLLRHMKVQHKDASLHDTDYTWESKTAKQCCEEAEMLKDRGNRALQDKDLTLAMDLYTLALQQSVKVQQNEEQASILFCNRAYVSLQMKNVEDAMQDTVISMKLQPNWFKGPRRLIQIYKEKGEVTKAISIGYATVMNYHLTNDERTMICLDVLILADSVKGGFKPLKELKAGKANWTRMLEVLIKHNHWHVIHVLIHGNDDTKPLITEFCPEHLTLSGLLDSCNPEQWKEWGEQLAQVLVQRGISYHSLHVNGRHGLHAALHIAIKTGSDTLLKHLFTIYIFGGARDQLDDEGDTLLHLACREEYETKEKMITMLLEYKLDPTIKNKAGQLPKQLLPTEDANISILEVAMQIKEKEREEEEKLSEATSMLQISGNSQVQSDEDADIIPLFDTEQWTSEEVEKWLDSKNLYFIKLRMVEADGRQLAQLRMLLETDGAYFYESVASQLGMTCTQMFTLGSALRELT